MSSRKSTFHQVKTNGLLLFQQSKTCHAQTWLERNDLSMFQNVYQFSRVTIAPNSDSGGTLHDAVCITKALNFSNNQVKQYLRHNAQFLYIK